GPPRALDQEPAFQLHLGTFGETRRGVKVIGPLPGEHRCLSLAWAVPDRAPADWAGSPDPRRAAPPAGSPAVPAPAPRPAAPPRPAGRRRDDARNLSTVA